MAGAWEFVQKMREDKAFRGAVQNIGDRAALWSYLESEGFSFDECDLVGAMAACMAGNEGAGS